MEIKVTVGDITKAKADAIIVTTYEEADSLNGDTASVDEALDGAISRLISQGEIKGKPGETTTILSLGKLAAARVLVLGLGKTKELSRDRIRGAVAEACRRLQKKNAGTVATTLKWAGIAEITLEAAAQTMSEGAQLGTYTFRRHFTKEAEHGQLSEFTIVTADKRGVSILERGCHQGTVLAKATNLARDMANEPGNYMTPKLMAEAAAGVAKDNGLEVEVLETKQMQKLGMGALLGVAQGSAQPPRFIVLRYKGSGSAEIDLALVGKGITFDSGGISIKPAAKMEEMKDDMAGGAAVIAAMGAIAQLKPKINVTGIIPATENLPGGSALKPGDALTAMNGKTIEIISTDAEGRLILADGLSYAKKLGAKRIIDAATLTGACRVALGQHYSGAFTNNQELIDKVASASEEAGEHIWRMPLAKQYKEQLKSEVADMKNVGGRYGGAITAALFLAEFVGDTPWVHLDIAGPSTSEKDHNDLVKGATGVPTRTLVNLAMALARE
ncbi:leucyl aminopeptidase [Chloroflexota bacterium]